MAGRETVGSFEEADKKRNVILAWTAAACGSLAWLCKESTIGLGLITAIAAYLMTGNRYQWIYIFKKTFRRDLLCLRIGLPVIFKIYMWEKNRKTVLTVWEENVENFGNKKAIVMDERYFTFRQGDEFSNRIAWYFKGQGFKKGEVIALLMETQPEYVFLWLGLAKLGVTTSLINNNLRGSALLHCLKVASCKAVIFGDEMLEAIKEIQKDIQEIPLYQYNSPDRDNAVILENTVPLATDMKEMSIDRITDVIPAKSIDNLMYIYTSGTTGLPKAAIITHMRYLLIPSGLHALARLSSSDIIYDPLPLHHTAGGVLGVGQALVHGCTIVLKKKFSASNYWKDAAKHGCTVTQYIGEICRYLLATPPNPADKTHQVRVVIGNGLRSQIWEQFMQRFNIANVVEFYGATEGNSNLVNIDSKIGAVGFISRFLYFFYPLLLVKCDVVTGHIIRDKKGLCIPCKPLEPGLLLGKIDKKRALHSFAGYADKTASEKKIVTKVQTEEDIYFNSGDVFVMDHFGYFYFKDRTGDTFRWRGENVSTAEVEGVISNLAGLNDAIVFGVKVPNVEGKAGMAAIADPDRKLDISFLGKGLKDSLPAYARPLFIRILHETPLTSTFKLKKKELMEQSYNKNEVEDEMYFLEQKTGEYVPLTQKLYEDICNGVIRL